ncbi:hypothetical protein GQ457_18G016640 [Hibiscus cannabinus]
MPPTNLQSHDFIGWKWRDNREFSVRSAYDLRAYSRDVHEEVWKVVATFRGLPRIRMFLWQLCGAVYSLMMSVCGVIWRMTICVLFVVRRGNLWMISFVDVG